MNAANRIKAAEQLMYSFVQVRTEGELPYTWLLAQLTEDEFRNTLIKWRNTAIRLKQLRLLADTSVAERQDRLVADTYGTWRERYKDRGLKAFEEEVLLRREDALMFSVWDAWKARSKVSFADHSRLPRIGG